jgi:acyl-coenzyme A synthetase/AMP-(fatty) acid ligase
MPGSSRCHAEFRRKPAAPYRQRRRDLVFRGEDKVQSRMSWDEAAGSGLKTAAGDEAPQGIGKGDRVAAMMPNMPETIALMLATASIGAIWSSCSPDFGEQGVLDRFGQIEPKLFIACDGYWYAGKRAGRPAKVTAVAKSLGVPACHRPLCRRCQSGCRRPSAGERQDAGRFHRAPFRAPG